MAVNKTRKATDFFISLAAKESAKLALFMPLSLYGCKQKAFHHCESQFADLTDKNLFFVCKKNFTSSYDVNYVIIIRLSINFTFKLKLP